jgi:hypothetical protein
MKEMDIGDITPKQVIDVDDNKDFFENVLCTCLIKRCERI